MTNYRQMLQNQELETFSKEVVEIFILEFQKVHEILDYYEKIEITNPQMVNNQSTMERLIC